MSVQTIWQKHKKAIIPGFLVLLILIFVLKIAISSGLFRTVKNSNLDKCRTITGIKGPEDLAYNRHDQTIFFSSDVRAEDAEKKGKNGAIWSLHPVTYEKANLTPELPFEFHPHGLGLVEGKKESILYVINHRKEFSSIEVFKWKGAKLRHVKTINDPMIVNPNDIHPVAKDQFFLTHDHGSKNQLMKMVGNLLSLDRGYVTFFQNNVFKVVADSIAFANGIVGKDRTLYVSSSLDQKINVYDVADDFTLKLSRTIKMPGLPDNLTLDKEGNLWVALHLNAFALKDHMGDQKKLSPFEIIKIIQPDAKAELKSVLSSDGEMMSGASVAAKIEGQVFAGSIYQEKVMVCLLK